jgi:RHS repeat-associated protein
MPPEQDIEYHPYGEQQIYTDTLGQEYRFTGKEHDPETNNDYFGARYYSSTMGRFLTPDWSATPAAIPYASLGNPQTLNLYSYVENNPITGTDPDGHYSCNGVVSNSPCPGDNQAPDVRSDAKKKDEKLIADLKAFIEKAQQEYRTAQGKLNSLEQTAKKGLDTFNDYLGFGATDCASGGNCGKAVNKAIGAVVAGVASDGISEEGAAARESVSVYRILGKEGETIYVGITNNLARRGLEHGADLDKIIGGLSRADARAVEQRLIKEYGLSKDSGKLLNKINSIARKNPNYERALVRGEQLLRSVGFKLARPTI